MSLKFPFDYANVVGLGRLFYPVVVLDLKTVDGWKKFEFLVDTGADLTTIPLHLLSGLGIRKSKLQTDKTLGVGGIRVKTWEFKMPIRIGEIEIAVTCSAVEDKEGTIPLLLGRKDVFESRFNLLLDSKRKVTVISENF